MQFLSEAKQKAARFATDNATTLLTAGGVVGVVATAVLAGRGGYKFGQILREAEYKATHDEDGAPLIGLEPYKMPTTEKAKLIGLYFGPPVLTGGGTIAAIIMSHRMSSAKIAGLAAAYGLAERNFSEYREKVTEKLTGPKKTAIDDELAQDRMNKADPSSMVVIEGEVLCYDEPTNRYFRSTMEKIRRAVNKTNEAIIHQDCVDATFFYHQLGLDAVVWSDLVGWNTDDLLELKYTTSEAPDGRPCIAINFETFPRQDYANPKHS